MIEINSKDNNGSSDSSLTRKEFIKKVVKGAAVTGGLVAAPAVLDKFLVPRAYAATSFTTAAGCGKKNAGSSTTAAGSPDVVAVNGQNIYCGSTGGLTTGQSKQPDTACVNGGDNSLNCP